MWGRKWLGRETGWTSLETAGRTGTVEGDGKASMQTPSRDMPLQEPQKGTRYGENGPYNRCRSTRIPLRDYSFLFFVSCVWKDEMRALQLQSAALHRIRVHKWGKMVDVSKKLYVLQDQGIACRPALLPFLLFDKTRPRLST